MYNFRKCLNLYVRIYKYIYANTCILLYTSILSLHYNIDTVEDHLIGCQFGNIQKCRLPAMFLIAGWLHRKIFSTKTTKVTVALIAMWPTAMGLLSNSHDHSKYRLQPICKRALRRLLRST